MISEHLIEKAVVRYAKSKGFLAYKWSSPAKRGVHDHIFFKAGLAFTIEFKAPKKKATALQAKVAEELTGALVPCRCVDSIVKGRDFVDKMFKVCDDVLLGKPRVFKELKLDSFKK